MKEISYHDIDFSPEINRFDQAEKLAKAHEKNLVLNGSSFKDRLEAKISSALFMENIQEANRLFNMLNRMDAIGLRII